MKDPVQKIPDFALSELHKKHSGKYERVQKSLATGTTQSSRETGTEISLLHSLDQPLLRISSKRPKTVPLEPYQRQFRVNSMRTKNKFYWDQPDIPKYSQKQFPDFKSPVDEGKEKKNYRVTVGSSSEHLGLNIEKQEEDEINDSGSYGKNYCTALKPLKKQVKWQDGYCATPSLEWYPSKSDYHTYNDTSSSKIHRTYSYNNILSYGTEDYTNDQSYDYNKYDYSKYDEAPTYSSTSKFYPYDYKYSNRHHHYPLDYSSSSKYGDASNWLYLQEQKKTYSPYFYDFDSSQYDKYFKSFKSYKNSNTQYDFFERGHNKKLQVSHSESSRICNQKAKVESKKVGSERSSLRLTKSDELMVQHAGTQIIETKPQGHQTILGDTDPKSEENKLDECTIISRFLLELTDKLKSSENSLVSIKKKCNLVDRDVQYEDPCTRMRRPPRTSLIRRKLEAKSKRIEAKVMKHETTQYEDISKNTECEKKTSSSLNNSDSVGLSEFERQLFSKSSKSSEKDNFCEFETRKRRGLKSGICEDRTYPKRLVKKKTGQKNVRKDDQSIDDSQVSLKSGEQQNKNIFRRRTDLRPKSLIPFLVGKLEKVTTPVETLEFVEHRKKELKEECRRHRKRSLSCDLVKRGSSGLKNALCTVKRGRSASSDHSFHRGSSRSDLSGPEDGYFDKYTVRLSNTEEELTLYDVKPKLRNYLVNKGMTKKIVEKLPSA